jgi:hypothetical protein
MSPAPAAGEIEMALSTSGEPMPVTFSLETAHECVAVVRLQGAPGYRLAVWAIDGRGADAWQLRPSEYASVSEALALVGAVVLDMVGNGWRR